MGKTKEKGAGDSGLGAGTASSNVVDVPAVPPSFTLSARHGFDVLAMIGVVSLAEGLRMKEQDPDRFEDLQVKMREFELYEEAHRPISPAAAEGSGA